MRRPAIVECREHIPLDDNVMTAAPKSLPFGSQVNAGGADLLGYMQAMQDLSVLADEEGHRIMGACPPEQMTTLQLIQSFVRYARAHRSELQGNAVVAVFRALQEAYPCRAVTDIPRGRVRAKPDTVPRSFRGIHSICLAGC